MKRSIRSLTVGLLVMGALSACGDSSGDGGGTTCGAGTSEGTGGDCVSLVSCGDGTELQGNVCQPNGENGPACGTGTEDSGGQCVPNNGACGAGTTFDDETDTCVPGAEVVCGAGTTPTTTDTGIECVLNGELVCGAGTELADGACSPICNNGQFFDAVTEGCVDSCAPGTTLGVDTGVCESDCGPLEYYDPDLARCLGVPGCGRNTGEVFDPENPECEGWPFQELTLETLCARRAFYLCDAVFDPACECENAGDYYGGGGHGIRPLGSGGILFDVDDRDYGLCLSDEFLSCESLAGILRYEVDKGWVEVDTDVLTVVDDYFAQLAGQCTVPVDFEPYPDEDVFGDLFSNALGVNDSCDESSRSGFEENGFCLEGLQCACPDGGCEVEGRLCLPPLDLEDVCDAEDIDRTCDDDAFCGCPLVDGGCLDSPRTCQPDREEGEGCIDSFAQCQEGLYCDTAFTGQCQPLAGVDDTCYDGKFETPCAEGLECRQLFVESEFPDACEYDSTSTCQLPGLGNGDCCTVPDAGYDEDFCGAGFWCDDRDAGTPGDSLGRCRRQADLGDSCDYCNESGETAPRLNLYTECVDGSACVLTREGDSFDESCEAAFSICPLLYSDLYSVETEGDGFCD